MHHVLNQREEWMSSQLFYLSQFPSRCWFCFKFDRSVLQCSICGLNNKLGIWHRCARGDVTFDPVQLR